jgi:hypothetical protein
MNKDDAIAKIRHSQVTVEAQIITPLGHSYAEYVQELYGNLLACVIEPVKVKITSACASEGDFERYRNEKVWAIARDGGSWLLALESADEFALGFGDDPMDIMMHGFSSNDALGEWCT